MAKRIALVDDHEIVRRGLTQLIGGNARFEVIAEAGSAAEALESLVENTPDLVLVDLVLGEGPDGIQLTKAIKAEHPLMPVLVLSGRDESLFAERALLAGASGYLMKEEAVEVLFDAIDAAIAGRVWVSPAMRERLLPPAPTGYGALTDVRDEVGVELLAELRRGNRTVGGISRTLSRNHMAVDRALDTLKDQLGLPSRAGLFLFVQPS